MTTTESPPPTPPRDALLLPEPDTAELLHVSEMTLRRLRREGAAPPWIYVKGSVRYIRAELPAWIQSRIGAPVPHRRGMHRRVGARG